ncbi:putative endonuclease LCL3 [Leucoagaricus sp. SymC.cos]|nr:putative endonuclease LCL3 [Leucoagaricus sp. SymC.cos]
MLWFSKAPQEPEVAQEAETEHFTPNFTHKTRQEFERVKKDFESLPVPFVALVAFGLGCACSAGGAVLYARYGRRIQNSDWVTPDLLVKNRWLRGVVTSVGDADNFRFFHTPSFGGWRWPLKFRRIPTSIKDLQGQTLHIRVAGVDAPEASHFGRIEQPYAAESLAWLQEKILGKVVYCRLIRRDQYSRVVANVHLAPRFLPGAFFFGKNLPLEMLRAGCATTYEQAGAEYGKEGKEEYLRVEAEARAARKGMWRKGVTIETPAEYKRRHASVSPEPKPEPKPEPTAQGRTRSKARAKLSGGWFSRLF